MTEHIDVSIVGVAALLMHSGTLADPLNPIARQLARLASRKKKTEADLERIADLEWTGGLWLEDGRPCIRGDAIEAALCQSAARRRAKAIYRGAVVVRGNPLVEYDGPKTVAGLRDDERFRYRAPVALNGRRLIRTRPSFSCWWAKVRIDYLPSFVAREDLIDVLVAAGDTIGIGDFRPRFGRFSHRARRGDVTTEEERLSGQDEAPLGGAWHPMARPTDEAIASSVSPHAQASDPMTTCGRTTSRSRDDRHDRRSTLLDATINIPASSVFEKRKREATSSLRVIDFMSDTSRLLDVASLADQKNIVVRAGEAAGLRIGAYVLELSRQPLTAPWGWAMRDLVLRARAGNVDAVVLTHVDRLADDHEAALLAAVLLAERGVRILEAEPEPPLATACMKRGLFMRRCSPAFGPSSSCRGRTANLRRGRC